VLAIEFKDGGDAASRWWYALKAPDGTWKPLAAALRGAPADIDLLLDFWGGEGLAIRSRAPGAARETWSFFLRRGSGAYEPVVAEGLPARLRSVLGERSSGLLGLESADGGWTLLVAGPAGFEPARAPGLPARIADLRRPVGAPRIAVRPEDAPGAPPRWIWLARGDGGKAAVVGETASPTWVGVPYRHLAGGIAFEGAAHSLDGREVAAVPEPAVWFYSDLSRDTSGMALLAPDRVPAGVELVGCGPRGVVLLYREGGRLRAAAFSAGTVEVAHERGVAFIENHLSDGTTRLHRLSDPTLWISRFDREVGGRSESVHFDDRGYFYSDSDRLSEIMTFRRGNELLGFDQLAAYLFRPDKLEERLGLEPGKLFTLTEADRSTIAKARGLTDGDRVDLAALVPPRVVISPLPEQVTSPTIDVSFAVEVRGDPHLRASIRVVGQGLARGGSDVELRAAPRGEGEPLAAEQRGITVFVPPGHQCIEVRVTDALQLSSVARRCIERKRIAGEQHDLYVALLAASDHPPWSGFSPLPEVRRDAAAVAAVLRAQEGRQYRHVHVRTWCDAATAGAGRSADAVACDAPASRAAIATGVPVFFADVRDGDDAILYVVGHGDRSPEGAYYYVPSDGRADDRGTLLGWSALHEFLTGAGSVGRRLLFLDTCHAGAIASGQEEERMVTQAAERENLFIMAASAADASAYESPLLGNGIFTYVFKRAMQGEADTLPEDGVVQFSELALFLRREVDATAREVVKVYQVPHVPLLGPEADFDVARVPRALWRVHVTVLNDGDVDFDAAARWGDELSRVDGIRIAAAASGATMLVQLTQHRGERFDVVVKRREGAETMNVIRRFGVARGQVVPAVVKALEMARKSG
jgi:hypothetical protein